MFLTGLDRRELSSEMNSECLVSLCNLKIIGSRQIDLKFGHTVKKQVQFHTCTSFDNYPEDSSKKIGAKMQHEGMGGRNEFGA